MGRRLLLTVVLTAIALPLSAQERFDSSRLLADLKILSSDEYEGRDAGSPGGAKARQFLEKGFESVGLPSCGASYEQPFAINGRNSAELSATNLLGLIAGSEHPDKYLVVSAHYDHVGVRGGQIYNGADDNASGAAALKAIATYFLEHTPKHSIVIAAFDAEEKGLRGARAFIEEPCVEIDAIVMNVNLDMISRNEAGEIYAAGTSHYPALRAIIEDVDEGRDFTLLFGHDEPGTGRDDWTMSSDHGPFHRAGIPFIVFGVEDHEGYHRPSDDYEFITPAFYIAVVDGIIEAIERFDRNLPEIEATKEQEF